MSGHKEMEAGEVFAGTNQGVDNCWIWRAGRVAGVKYMLWPVESFDPQDVEAILVFDELNTLSRIGRPIA
jgi:hypothetical protein